MEPLIKKPLKLAAWSGAIHIVLIVLIFVATFYLISTFITSSLGGGIDQIDSASDELGEKAELIINIAVISILITSPFSLLFTWGFVILGRKFRNKKLEITSYIYMALTVLSILTISIFYFNGDIFDTNTEPTGGSFGETLKNSVSSSPVIGPIFSLGGDLLFWPLLILFLIVVLSLKIIFSIGLIQLKNKNNVPYAKASGINELISLVFKDLRIIALIVETIMFFKMSELLENEELSQEMKVDESVRIPETVQSVSQETTE